MSGGKRILEEIDLTTEKKHKSETVFGPEVVTTDIGEMIRKSLNVYDLPEDAAMSGFGPDLFVVRWYTDECEPERIFRNYLILVDDDLREEYYHCAARAQDEDGAFDDLDLDQFCFILADLPVDTVFDHCRYLRGRNSMFSGVCKNGVSFCFNFINTNV
jgi:hypothetical protein